MKQSKRVRQATIGTIAVRSYLANAIKAEREARGWTRYELAKRAGMQLTHLTKIEQAEFSARIDTINHLCRVLGIRLVLPIY